jgi:hypothetical protein
MRPSKLGWIAFGLAAMHTLPARHHLGDFFAHPSIQDAWKGFGAAIAVAVWLLPVGLQARIARNLWKPVLFAIAAAHMVPALDHLPKLLAAPSWADAWKGIGSTVAVVWFVLPRSLQIEGVKWLARVAKGNADAFRHGRENQSASFSVPTHEARALHAIRSS